MFEIGSMSRISLLLGDKCWYSRSTRTLKLSSTNTGASSRCYFTLYAILTNSDLTRRLKIVNNHNILNSLKIDIHDKMLMIILLKDPIKISHSLAIFYRVLVTLKLVIRH